MTQLAELRATAMHLLTIHQDVLWGSDADTDPVSLHGDDGHLDLAVDHDRFTHPAREH
jgi:hypothetical protein